jgi:hypothetical protein
LTKHLKDHHLTVYQKRIRVVKTKIRQHSPIPFDKDDMWDDDQHCPASSNDDSDEDAMDLEFDARPSQRSNAFSSFHEISRRN